MATLGSRLRQIALGLLNAAALFAREVAGALLADRRTTAAGVTFCLAYWAARRGVVLPEWAPELVVGLAFVALGFLASDSNHNRRGRNR